MLARLENQYDTSTTRTTLAPLDRWPVTTYSTDERGWLGRFLQVCRAGSIPLTRSTGCRHRHPARARSTVQPAHVGRLSVISFQGSSISSAAPTRNTASSS